MTTTPATSSGGTAFPWLLTVLAVVAMAVLLSLGTWQVQRLAWKEALVATIDARVAAPPKPLSEIEASNAAGDDIDYQPVEASGEFVHADEQFYFATHDGQSGWFVYTPLALGGGRFVFVNRGFVPYDRKDQATRLPGQIAGKVAVQGLARVAPTEKPSSILPDNDPAKNVYYWKDLHAMEAQAGLAPASVLPFFIDAGPAANPGGLPVGGVTIVSLPNNHLQYAVTWYGLAAALAGVFAAWLLRWRKARQTTPRP